jgi:hypothetical protein
MQMHINNKLNQPYILTHMKESITLTYLVIKIKYISKLLIYSMRDRRKEIWIE